MKQKERRRGEKIKAKEKGSRGKVIRAKEGKVKEWGKKRKGNELTREKRLWKVNLEEVMF